MFVHLVLIKLKPGIERSDPRVQAWESAFKALPQHCSGTPSIPATPAGRW